jgi:heme A synthase
MKKFLSFVKSPVGKFHASFALFILFNLLSGVVNIYMRYTLWLVSLHFYSGLLIVFAPLLYLAAAKNRGIVLKAFGRMALPHKADFRKRKPALPAFKLATLLAALLVLANALTGISVRFTLLAAPAYHAHVFAFKALLAIVPVHVMLAVYLRGERAKKPARADRAAAGNGLR